MTEALPAIIAILIATSVGYITNRWLRLRGYKLFESARHESVENLDQRNRRVMLDHVENFWVKGILEKSLHGAALLELGIKEDPSAVNYPWTLKKEPTKETLPSGKSMLEIFREVGLERSLLILGAPGSGKTTMLLELARQLIERARQDETEPIPVVFNLASWKENQTLADWLVEQLNVVYYVPKKTAHIWVNGNRLLLLLDGLDEVNRDSISKCVEAINHFRSEYGLTSMVVCSRIEEYLAIDTKLSFEGAIILQPLTTKQVDAYLDRFGKSLAAVKQLLKKDQALQELAEIPLMLSIMALTYKDREADELVASADTEKVRKHLFDTYIARMFERSTRITSIPFSKQQTLHSLHWLAHTMIQQDIFIYQIETMQPSWLEHKAQYPVSRLLLGLGNRITMVDRLSWSKKESPSRLLIGTVVGLILGLILGIVGDLLSGLLGGMLFGLILGLIFGLTREQIEETTYPGQRLRQTFINASFVALLIGPGFGLSFAPRFGLLFGVSGGLLLGLIFWLQYGGKSLIQHYLLRLVLSQNHLLPRHLIAFLEYAVSLIFLRRVGGSYIFIHRLLMEHFAEMDA